MKSYCWRHFREASFINRLSQLLSTLLEHVGKPRTRIRHNPSPKVLNFLCRRARLA